MRAYDFIPWRYFIACIALLAWLAPGTYTRAQTPAGAPPAAASADQRLDQ